MNDARPVRIHVPEERLSTVCRKFGIRKLELFGSVLRADFSDDSDVDVIVEFQPGRTPGFAFFEIEEELEAVFGRPVDLLTRRSIETDPNYIFRQHVLSDVETIYEAP